MSVILCVVDKSDELRLAIRYAALFAKKHGHEVGLFYAMEPGEFQHWKAVETLQKEEARADAEKILQKWAYVVEGLTGDRPLTYIREGKLQESLLAIIEEEQDICHLVLASAEQGENPGPLVTAVTSKLGIKFRIPIIIVPGQLDEQAVADLL